MKRLYIVMILVFQIHFMSAQMVKVYGAGDSNDYYNLEHLLKLENTSFTEKDTIFSVMEYYDSFLMDAIECRKKKKYKQSNHLFSRLLSVNDTLNHFFKEAGHHFDSYQVIIYGLKGLAENFYIQKQNDKAKEFYVKILDIEVQQGSEEFVFLHFMPKRKFRRKLTK